MNTRPQGPSQWRIARSIAIELDVAAYFVRMRPDALPKAHADLAMTIPPVWFDEFDALSAHAAPDRGLQSTLEFLARWSGVLEIEDYDAASAAMRDLTPQDAIAQVVSASGLEPAAGLAGRECLIDLEQRLATELPATYGLYPASDPAVLARKDDALRFAVSALRGEPLNGRYWHWTDRFYYKTYRPWRANRQAAMKANEKTAIDALGAAHGTGVPELDWLDPRNPLVATPSLRDAITTGVLDVIFWTEPFSLSDTWALTPGAVLASYAEPSHLYQHYEAARDQLTTKLKALADPTRMSILRMIRMHDHDNTQLAGHMGISRPTASVHTKILADAGIITTTREGRQARHAFHPDAITQLCHDLLELLDVPQPRPDP